MEKFFGELKHENLELKNKDIDFLESIQKFKIDKLKYKDELNKLREKCKKFA